MFGGVEYSTEGGETGDVPGGVEAEDGAGEVDERGTSSIENGYMAMNYWQITIKGEVFRQGDCFHRQCCICKNHPCQSQSETCNLDPSGSVPCQNAVHVQHIPLHP